MESKNVRVALKALIALAQSRGWKREKFITLTKVLWGETPDVTAENEHAEMLWNKRGRYG